MSAAPPLWRSFLEDPSITYWFQRKMVSAYRCNEAVSYGRYNQRCPSRLSSLVTCDRRSHPQVVLIHYHLQRGKVCKPDCTKYASSCHPSTLSSAKTWQFHQRHLWKLLLNIASWCTFENHKQKHLRSIHGNSDFQRKPRRLGPSYLDRDCFLSFNMNHAIGRTFHVNNRFVHIDKIV